MALNLKAENIGWYAAKELVELGSGAIGQTLNVFANSFYVKTWRNGLIHITNRPVRSPITVNVEGQPNFNCAVKPLREARVVGSLLQADEVEIDLSGADLYGAGPRRVESLSPSFQRIGKHLHYAAFMLRTMDTSRGILGPSGPEGALGLLRRSVRKFVAEGILPLLEGRSDGFIKHVRNVLGSGLGFTPSGDDFLGGFLAVYNALADAIDRDPIIIGEALLAENTGWLSGKLLDYMQRGIVDEQVDRVILSAAGGDGDSFLMAIQDLASRGHTSGIDMSAGAILALGLASDAVFNDGRTRKLIQDLGLSP